MKEWSELKKKVKSDIATAIATPMDNVKFELNGLCGLCSKAIK